MKAIPHFAGIVAAILLSGSALAATPTGTAADFGSPVASASLADRRVVLQPGDRYANVNNGETVEFIINGKSFVWHFDTYPNETSVDLSLLAPSGVATDGVRVYVGANPLYRG